MGTIVTRKRKDGSIDYLAQISINRDGKRAHSESSPFDRQATAPAWLKSRKKDLNKTGAVLGTNNATLRTTLGEAIDLYIKDNVRAIGRTKAQVLRSIKTHKITGMVCSDIESHYLIDFTKSLTEGKATKGCLLPLSPSCCFHNRKTSME